jgi:PRC-barrel domain
MLRKSLIAFTAATVVGAGSQAVAAGFRHAMSTPRIPSSRSEEKAPTSTHAEIPIAKLDRKDLIGKKMYDHQGNFLGKVVSVIKDDAGEIASVQLRATVTREARVPANQVNIKPDGGTLTLAESKKGLQWNYIGPRSP